MTWAKPKESRDQIVLFAEKLDDAVPLNHSVRTFDAILDQVDWLTWEAIYDLAKGQSPIHPRVLASFILFGLLKRIRTSRALDEALAVRMDFRWLVEGRSIDQSTIARSVRYGRNAFRAVVISTVDRSRVTKTKQPSRLMQRACKRRNLVKSTRVVPQ